MSGTEGCDCTTTDCQDPRVEPIDASTVRFVGRCSPRTMTFGCKARVRPGVYPRAAHPHAKTICVD